MNLEVGYTPLRGMVPVRLPPCRRFWLVIEKTEWWKILRGIQRMNLIVLPRSSTMKKGFSSFVLIDMNTETNNIAGFNLN